MSVIIRVSYQTEDELFAITDRLADLPLRVGKPAQGGGYKRVYIKGETAEKPVATAQNEQQKAKYPVK